ncbi:RNA polymerase sigma factor [Agriterribacter sp.]|uniref:RNA polymerase sigma factor n=1 Tax=Agriterribacter sp. TaxID=2821509 RepID=UPI002BD31D51|nr:RNA polymerase sigma factor [Agriterribacter sp.]HTN08944.1 RNA polymerase sigma factor [Agriterribacter sp.]
MSLPSNHNISESDLIKGCLDGDRRMQEHLYQRFSPKMYAVCLRYAGKAEDAQDILQDGFVKIFKNLHMYRGDGSFEGWIRRIFVNTAIEHYRKQANLYPVTENHENLLETKELSAFDSLSMKDLMKMIQELSPGYRTVFNLYVVEGYSHKEIAQIAGISEGTSKSQLARAKGVLQNIIKTKRTLS